MHFYLLSLGLDFLEKSTNWLTIEPAINLDPNTLYLDSLHNKNITNLLEALIKNACNVDKNIVLVRKKRTQRKVVLLLDKNVAPVGKKRTREKKKVCPRKKMHLRKKKRYTKKTLSIIGFETDKIKLDNAKRPGSKILNADNIVKPASELLNTSSEVKSDFHNREGKKSSNKSIKRTETRIMCSILISFLYISFFFSTSSEMVNAMILKFPNIHLSVNFETIS